MVHRPGCGPVKINKTSCLILTSAHHPADARLNRHLDTLNRRGISTTLISERPGSPGRRMLWSPILVWRHLRSVRPDAVLLPDPELLVTGTIVARLLGVRAVLDIHEDFAAVAADREWIPSFLRPPVAFLSKLLVALGRRWSNATIVAAEHLSRPGDVVVPNFPSAYWFPGSKPPGSRPAAVYVGDITVSRGAHEMVGLLDRVRDLHLELIGPISDELRTDLLVRAKKNNTADRLHLTGRLSYEEAWKRAAGATAGLSLLRNTPAYRAALPTKLWEYLATGLPVIASSLPAQRELLNSTGAGVVVGSTEEAAQLLERWLENPDEAISIGRRGRQAYEAALENHAGESTLVKAVCG